MYGWLDCLVAVVFLLWVALLRNVILTPEVCALSMLSVDTVGHGEKLGDSFRRALALSQPNEFSQEKFEIRLFQRINILGPSNSNDWTLSKQLRPCDLICHFGFRVQ
jgi:hypothetical protein